MIDFAPHYDGPFVKNFNERSMKTFMIYLNDDFNGGTTNFLHEDQPLFADSSGRFCAPESQIYLKVKPEKGMCIVFNHHFLHEGDKVEGFKFIMRSDVMYKREKMPENIPEHHFKAATLWVEGTNLEMQGKPMEAMEMFRKATKIWPQIEQEGSK